ncbi:MAG TPA: hypothetical protein VFB34_03050 [Chloroflexota bacterium]|nr:hypothetical protein [Chloroflexota bacterium]
MRFAGLTLVVLVLAGCGSAATVKSHKGSSTTTRVPAGVIQFGAGASKFNVQRPTSSFKLGKRIAWVAHLSRKSPSLTLTWQILRERGPGPSAVVSSSYPLASKKDTLISGSMSGSQLVNDHLNKPGSYAMRFLVGTRILAHGSFKTVR